MQITLAAQNSVGPTPPTPPPLPTQFPNTATAPGNKIPPPPPPQDTATRKQQQPLSAISIQDLNSVQVIHLRLVYRLKNIFYFFFVSLVSLASSNR